MRQSDYRDWLESTVTIQFLKLIKEHKDASFKEITEGLINIPSVRDIDLYNMSQLKGQVHAFEKILDTDLFVDELIEDKPKEEDIDENEQRV